MFLTQHKVIYLKMLPAKLVTKKNNLTKIVNHNIVKALNFKQHILLVTKHGINCKE